MEVERKNNHGKKQNMMKTHKKVKAKEIQKSKTRPRVKKPQTFALGHESHWVTDWLRYVHVRLGQENAFRGSFPGHMVRGGGAAASTFILNRRELRC